MTSPAELLVDEIRDKLDGQLATLESARTRAGVAVSASGVIAGLFAQHLKEPIGNWGVAAIAAFVVSVFPAVWILLPHRMTLSPKAGEWIDFAAKHDAFVRGNLDQQTRHPEASGDLGVAQLAVAMVESMNTWYAKNGPLLDAVHLCVGIAFAGVMVQIICWAGSIGHGPGYIWPALAVIAAVAVTMFIVERRSRMAPPKPSAESRTTEEIGESAGATGEEAS